MSFGNRQKSGQNTVSSTMYSQKLSKIDLLSWMQISPMPAINTCLSTSVETWGIGVLLSANFILVESVSHSNNNKRCEDTSSTQEYQILPIPTFNTNHCGPSPGQRSPRQRDCGRLAIADPIMGMRTGLHLSAPITRPFLNGTPLGCSYMGWLYNEVPPERDSVGQPLYEMSVEWGPCWTGLQWAAHIRDGSITRLLLNGTELESSFTGSCCRVRHLYVVLNNQIGAFSLCSKCVLYAQTLTISSYSVR